MLKVLEVSRSYGDIKALQNFSLEVPSSQVLGFLGPNGAGKSTAIKVIAGYISSDTGLIEIDGIDMETNPDQAKSCVGYLPENNPFYSEMRVCDALDFYADIHGMSKEKKKDSIDRVIHEVELQDVFLRTIGQCSKGFRQRVGLAQALIHDPKLLLLDEPTNGLDPLQVVEMRNLIRRLGEKKTVIITSHILSEIEAVAHRVIMMNQGVLAFDDYVRRENFSCVEIESSCSAKVIEEIVCSLDGKIVEVLDSQLDAGCYALCESAGVAEIFCSSLAKEVVSRNFDLYNIGIAQNFLENQFRRVCGDKK